MIGKIIVGGVIEKDGKYLLVQEAKEECSGQWNLPAGHLEPNETLLAGTTREIREETGLETEPTALCHIGNWVWPEGVSASLIFTVKILGGEIKIDPAEILDIKWFTYEEILQLQTQGLIRNETLMLHAIDNARQSLTASLDLIKIYNRKVQE